ncbi:ketodeoxygluconokinase [Vibrio sp. 10N.286.49.C2]|uniref:sugar kinase n=1 Tax=unclassified Vibrio TaxID=2614977 RepID=UPI000C83BA97|nr:MULTISPECIES: sugar kinase [unclassified Vibrio]PMH35194.1 ketodeoxygluconokinase [Vibrio sp. 10N.286.49.C2]PMH57137.1 ketodeoxygluconokinase [Vibrio sp. 10N.286.49.B1]PMH82351.1 ketodeoxygluconokinase [Vibrio sp. 10N.286.48.B7]
MNQYKIAIIGECMVELQRKGELLKQSFGGDTLNTALYLSRLTQQHNLTVSYITALGNDPFSNEMMATWQSEGIDTSLILKLDDKMPGLYHIETDDTGERTFFYWRSDAAAKFVFDQPESAALIESLLEYDAVYLSGITLAILTQSGRDTLFNFLKAFKEKGGHVFFDNNFRPKLWADRQQAITNYTAMLELTSTALLTFEDDQALFGDMFVEQCIERTSEAGVSEIAIKRGAKDCLVVAEGQANYVAPKPVNNVLDTTAAGDSFSAGYLAKRLTGGTALQAAATGHKVAGAVIQHQGAIIPKEATPTID